MLLIVSQMLQVLIVLVLTLWWRVLQMLLVAGAMDHICREFSLLCPLFEEVWMIDDVVIFRVGVL